MSAISYACGLSEWSAALRVVTVCAVSVCRRLGDRKNRLQSSLILTAHRNRTRTPTDAYGPTRAAYRTAVRELPYETERDGLRAVSQSFVSRSGCVWERREHVSLLILPRLMTTNNAHCAVCCAPAGWRA